MSVKRNLMELDKPMPDDMFANPLLGGLPSEYKCFTMGTESMHSTLSSEVVINRLRGLKGLNWLYASPHPDDNDAGIHSHHKERQPKIHKVKPIQPLSAFTLRKVTRRQTELRLRKREEVISRVTPDQRARVTRIRNK